MEVLSFFQPQNLILKKRKTVFSMERLKERSVDFPEKKDLRKEADVGCRRANSGGDDFLYMNHVYKGGGIGEERALVIFFTAFRNFNT
jgi:hypothetical protein